MAKKRIPLTGEEVADIGAAIGSVAQHSEKLEERLQKVLQTSKGLSGGLAKQFKKVHQDLIKSTRQQEQALARLHRKKSQTAQDHSMIQNLQAQITEGKKQIKILDRVNTRTAAQSKSSSVLAAKLKSLTSVAGILNFAWNQLVKAFRNWEDLSRKWSSAMGQIAQQTGATADQTRNLAQGVSQMSGIFGSLEGDVDGIQLAGQFMGELTTAWREADEITPSFARSMLEVSRGFGVGTEGAAQLRRSLDALGIAENAEEFRAFSVRMLGFSEAIGANSAQMIADWNANASAIAQFGDQGERTFRDAALMANQFGFETGKIFQMAKGFDTFGQASNRVNQLNAVLGTTLSSYEMMIEQDPARRVEMVMQAVRDQGLEWSNLNRIQRMTLAEQMNLTEEEAARVFDLGETMEDIENARQAAAEQERRDALTQRENQQVMNRLLRRTSVVFEGLDRAIQRFWNALSRLLSPIFGDLNNGLTGMVDKATEFIQTMGQDSTVQRVIQDIADWIDKGLDELIEWLPTWDEFKVSAQQAWKVFQEEVPKAIELGEEVWNWLVKQKEEWDSGESAIKKFFDAIELGADIVIPLLRGLNALFEAVGGAFETFTHPIDTLLEAGRAAADLGGDGIFTSGDVSGRVEEGQAQRIARQSLDSNIRDMAAQNMSYQQIQTVIRRQDVSQRNRGAATYSSLRAPGQTLNQLIQQRYQAIAPTVTPQPVADSAVNQPATQPTITAQPGSGNGSQTVVIENVTYSILDGEKVAASVARKVVPLSNR